MTPYHVNIYNEVHAFSQGLIFVAAIMKIFYNENFQIYGIIISN